MEHLEAIKSGPKYTPEQLELMGEAADGKSHAQVPLDGGLMHDWMALMKRG